MKTIHFTIAFLLFVVLSYGQQKKTNDLSISVGGLTSIDVANVVSEILVSGITIGNVYYTNEEVTPAIAISYKRAIQNNWFVYSDGVIQSYKKDLYLNDTYSGEVKDLFATIGLGTEYHYIHGSWFQMYSGLAIAYSHQFSNYSGSSSDIEESSAGMFNFQVNALGFRVGKKFAAFSELGFGYKGLLTFGLSFQF